MALQLVSQLRIQNYKSNNNIHFKSLSRNRGSELSTFVNKPSLGIVQATAFEEQLPPWGMFATQQTYELASSTSLFH